MNKPEKTETPNIIFKFTDRFKIKFNIPPPFKNLEKLLTNTIDIYMR